MTKHLVIGDSHHKPGVSVERAAWAAEMALDERPDVIIDIGDWADMPSLSSYDKGQRQFEGRRYKNDIQVAVAARAVFSGVIESYNIGRRHNKQAQYLPRKVGLYGNHEHRIVRAVNLSPELEGTIDLADLALERYGWEAIPYLKIIEIDGIHYSHYFTSGVMGRPSGISGNYPASQILAKKMVSCVGGHIHVRDFCERTKANGEKILGLVCGCFFEHHEDWAVADTNLMWWRGLTILHDVENGTYDPEFFSMKRVKQKYAS